jgi:ankyrin repeat protein
MQWTKFGYTALHLACINNEANMVHLLLAHGANKSIRLVLLMTISDRYCSNNDGYPPWLLCNDFNIVDFMTNSLDKLWWNANQQVHYYQDS